MTTRVLITGASSGIGIAAAQQLAAPGVEVVMVSRGPVRGQAAVSKGGRARDRLHSFAETRTQQADRRRRECRGTPLEVDERLTSPGQEITQPAQEVAL